MSFSDVFDGVSGRVATVALALGTAFGSVGCMQTAPLVKAGQGVLRHDGYVIRRGVGGAVHDMKECALGRTYRCPQGEAQVPPHPTR